MEANARRMLQRAAIIVFAAEALQEVEEFSVTEEEMLDLRRISMLYDPAIQAFRHDMIEANPHLAAALTGFEAQHPDLCERLYMLGGIRSAVASTLAERDAVHSEDEQNPILTFQPKSSSDTTPPSS